jgi:PKD repeat protein
MKKFLLALVTLFVLDLNAQSAADAAVQISVSTNSTTPSITLSWVGNATTTSYSVYRKLKTATTWGAMLVSLSGTVNQYVDNTIAIGTNYEYRIVRTGSGYTGYGYVNSGINVPAVDKKGKIILLVDSTFIVPLATEIKRLENDLEGDGWTVVRHNVLRTGSVTHVKSFVVADYTADPTNTKAVLILGHVPVPYSGNMNPDGHPDHQGAWPTDTYYADANGGWTDVSVTSTTASPPRTQNIPGDKKFDQNFIPTDLELQVGRVDFANMPAFSASEQTLLKNYLDKDHDYRHKIYVAQKRAVVDDNFGYFGGEAFAASGYKNFGPLVGTASVTAGDYFTDMAAGSYQWSYGCGGGTYTSAGGIGSTSNFASSNLQGVFTMLFGSYFGDWDSNDNFLRAALAQGKTLTNVWSGRAHYQLHQMGLGENIGYCVMQTQNNIGSVYFQSSIGVTGRWIHHALMGDPTLRNDIVAPVSNVIATKVGNNCHISWSASTETLIAGYNIYMKNDTNTAYVKLNASPITATTYTDNCLLYKGIYKYMVRTVKLENTSSGTYFNLSEGISDTAYNNNNLKVHASFTQSAISNTVNLTNTSANATTYSWNFGDATSSTATSPAHTYTANGTYTITLIGSNSCNSDTAKIVVSIISAGINEIVFDRNVSLYPNPGNGKIIIESAYQNRSFDAVIYNSEGKQVFKTELKHIGEFDLSDQPAGVYFLQLKDQENNILTKKFVIQ